LLYILYYLNGLIFQYVILIWWRYDFSLLNTDIKLTVQGFSLVIVYDTKPNRN